MSTSHFCNGKWKPGPVVECPKHTRLSKKQTSVYRSGDGGDTSASGSGRDTSGSSSSPASGSD